LTYRQFTVDHAAKFPTIQTLHLTLTKWKSCINQLRALVQCRRKTAQLNKKTRADEAGFCEAPINHHKSKIDGVYPPAAGCLLVLNFAARSEGRFAACLPQARLNLGLGPACAAGTLDVDFPDRVSPSQVLFS
jgi:hypothetical protein